LEVVPVGDIVVEEGDGERVMRIPLTRDKILQYLSPWKLSELQRVITLRSSKLSDVDLKECYFEMAWQFRKDEFALVGWQEMSVEALKAKVREAHPRHPWFDKVLYPPELPDVDTLRTKEDIICYYGMLQYVPKSVYSNQVQGLHVVRSLEHNKKPGKKLVGQYLGWACRAGLDLPVIRGLAWKCREWNIDNNDAAQWAAAGGHADVLDLLASEFGAEIGLDCLTGAAKWGHDAMIDHLVEKNGVDLNGADGDGRTALHWAALCGRVRTVKHLVEKHNVDIHKRARWGGTALDVAEYCDRTECVAFLRELTYTQLLAGKYRGDVDVKLLVSAARRGDDAMIDLLVERYGVDPNGVDPNEMDGQTALHRAAYYGHVRTVKHLVEKHTVDIHKRARWGTTALDLAERRGRTECAAVLRGLMSARPPPS